MTPEEARALEPGTTDEPWKLLYRDTHPNAIPANVIIGEDEEALATYDDGYGGNPEWANPSGNLPLIAAAPDMRATIAAQTWEWGVEDAYGDTAWMVCDHYEGTQDSETEAREYLSTFGPDSIARLVRRPVGPVEVVEGSST